MSVEGSERAVEAIRSRGRRMLVNLMGIDRSTNYGGLASGYSLQLKPGASWANALAL